MLSGARRDVVPIGTELRALAWLGVMLIATGVGIVVKKHFHEIGPLSIAVIIGFAAAACYAYAIWRRTPLRDYIVLLGALLISTDVGFIESQWHLLGGEWQRHFLLLAVVHAIAAYYFGSRAILSLSVVALAAWLGIEQRSVAWTELEFASRAFICAGILALWRLVNRRVDFAPVFEHFAANVAFWGAIALTIARDTRPLGVILTLLFATASLRHGFRRRRELFVIYAGVYALIAVDIVITDSLQTEVLRALYLIVSTIAAIAALYVTHVRFQSSRLADD